MATTDEKLEALDMARAAGGDGRPRVKGDSTYVVQMWRKFLSMGDETSPVENIEAWADIATVTVPHRSPRKRVIGLALAESGIRPAADSEPLRLRVLDVASFHETTVEPFQPDAQWRVGS